VFAIGTGLTPSFHLSVVTPLGTGSTPKLLLNRDLMINNNEVWNALLKFVALIVILILASCGGNGGSSVSSVSPVTTFYTITAEAGSNGNVTPSGDTSVAQGASQSYTITPNSGFAVATLEVDGATVAKSTTYTFTNVRANHTIRATFSAAQAGDIALSLVAARTSGVAPLAVFFDASGTTDVGVTARPFHDLEYTWDFGDPTADTWAYGAQPGVSSKNSATGPVAAHVFEQPGTYTVTLTAFDGTNTVNTTQTITVDDPEVVFAGAKTACVSTAGVFTGCPSGAVQVTTSSFTTALGNISSTVKRILFRAGETWTTSSSYSITQAGPGLIGSFGTGIKPLINASGSSYSVISFNADDWRVMDLAIDGQAGTIMGYFNNGKTQITLLRDDVSNSTGAFWTNNGTTVAGGVTSDQFTVQDSTSNGIIGTAGNVASWVLGERFAFLGNFMDNKGAATSGGEHVLRFPKVIKGVISNNTAQNPGPNGKHDLKLHSSNPFSNSALWDGTYTEKVIISDNYFPGNFSTAYQVSIAAQNTSFDERLRDIIVERNWFTGGAGSQDPLRIAAVSCTVRNNIFDISISATYHDAIAVTYTTGDASPPPDNTSIYNNTIYSNASSSHVIGISISSPVLTTTVKNNLLSAPNASGPTMISGTGATLVQSNNVTNNVPSTLFVSSTPSAVADFALKSGSPAIGAGTPVPVWDDFRRVSRAATWDVGAYQY
jgi:hypothetical protein